MRNDNVKLYAVQVAPEEQYPMDLESDIECALEQQCMALKGNPYYQSHECDLFLKCKEALEESDLWDAIEQYKVRLTPYHSLRELFMDMLPPVESRGAYTLEEVSVMVRMVMGYPDCDVDFEWAMLRLLTIVSGHEWDSRELTGSVQGEWQTMFYDTEYWSKAALESFEAEYFNTGTEWVVTCLDHPVEDVDEIFDDEDSMHVYCSEYSTKGIKKQLREVYGSDDIPVVMYEHAGYTMLNKYKRVSD